MFIDKILDGWVLDYPFWGFFSFPYFFACFCVDDDFFFHLYFFFHPLTLGVFPDLFFLYFPRN